MSAPFEAPRGPDAAGVLTTWRKRQNGSWEAVDHGRHTLDVAVERLDVLKRDFGVDPARCVVVSDETGRVIWPHGWRE